MALSVKSLHIMQYTCKSNILYGWNGALLEKIPLQNFTSKVNLIKGVWNIKVTFVLTLLSVKMQI